MFRDLGSALESPDLLPFPAFSHTAFSLLWCSGTFWVPTPFTVFHSNLDDLISCLLWLWEIVCVQSTQNLHPHKKSGPKQTMGSELRSHKALLHANFFLENCTLRSSSLTPS